MNDKEIVGAIYILTNPSFPDYIKIGYADDVNKRLKQLNRSECIPFAFRLYAYYKVDSRLTDKQVHILIDSINPNLRAIDTFNGKRRKKEFYFMKAETAYQIFESIARINNLEKNLVKNETSEEAYNDLDVAEENRGIVRGLRFKEIEFHSSLTNKRYKSFTNEKGTLSIKDVSSGQEVLNNSNPSKRQIVRRALSDLTKKDENGTLYQLMHRLENIQSGDN